MAGMWSVPKALKGRDGRAKGRSSVLLAAGAGVAVVVVVTLALWSAMPRTPPYPWLFRGAYGVYAGSYMIGDTAVNVTSRVEVTDFNSTHATLTQVVTARAGSEVVNQTFTSWYSLQDGRVALQNPLNKVYEEDLTYRNSTRRCVVCEYGLQDGVLLVCYDKATSWIILQKNTIGDYHIEIALAETNIPGL